MEILDYTTVINDMIVLTAMTEQGKSMVFLYNPELDEIKFCDILHFTQNT